MLPGFLLSQHLAAAHYNTNTYCHKVVYIITMKSILQLLVLSAITNIVFAQNLVPNPGFEKSNSCPFSQAMIAFSPTHTLFSSLDSWVNPHEWSSSDYYNTCAPVGSGVNIPETFLAFRNARNGTGMAGIIPFSKDIPNGSTRYGEYIQCKLTKKLLAGYKYKVEFYVNYAYGPNLGWSHNFVAVDVLGAHFGDTAIYSSVNSQSPHLNAPYHISSPAGVYLADTTQWVKISGIYQAHGGEQFFTIGSFNDGTPVNFLPVTPAVPNPNSTYYSYYFIDDVSVVELPKCDTIINPAKDTTACKVPPLNMTITSSKPGASYLWSTGDITRNAIINNPGTYWCMASEGCNLTVDTFRVKALTLSETSVTDTAVCKDAVYTLSAPQGGIYYNWSNGGTTASITVNATGIYTCSSIINCVLRSDTFRVDNIPFSHAALGNDSTVCKEDNYILGAPLEHVKYKWNTGETGCCIPVQQSGVYILTVYNICESQTDSVKMEVQGCDDCLFVPTAFTPNADGRNDAFGATVKCPAERYNLKVYNRWGQMVYESRDFAQKWDGSYNGQPAPVGTYYYHVVYQSPLAKKQKLLKGDVTLIR